MRTCIKIIGLTAATGTAAFIFATPAFARTNAVNADIPAARHMALPKCAVDSPSGLLGINLPILSSNAIGRCS